MGEKRSRLVAKVDAEMRGQAVRCKGIRSSWNQRGSVAVGVLSILALLGPRPFAPLAEAQDTPAKTEAPAQPETPQEPVPPDPAQDPLQGSAEALSVKYRFIEKYSINPEPDRPDLLSQYVVGILETQKTEREKPQGAPDRFQFSHLTRYTERPAQVGKLGEVISAVRRYDKFRITQMSATPTPKKPPFEGLTILYLKRPLGQKPQFLSLTSDHPLREFEYSAMAKQVFVPQLAVLFAPTPQRVGDTWRISRQATQVLVNELPDGEDFEMNGRLIEVRKTGTETALTAVIGISGQMNLSLGKSMLNAQIHFVFEPTPAVAPPSDSGASAKPAESPTAKARGKREAGIVNARGRISRVLMAWVVSSPLDDGDGRLKQTVTYELNLERRLTPLTSDAAGTQNALQAPDPPPTADESNSWLVHEDPLGRFHFRHPQELAFNPRMIDPNFFEFADQDREVGQDVFILQLPPGAEDPQSDRAFRDSEKFEREIDAYWAKRKVEIVRGPIGWLPEAEWAPLKVYRKELGVKTAGADQAGQKVPRVYCDYYLVLSKPNECFHVQSMTTRDDHVNFRTQAERMIKSVIFGPKDLPPKAPAIPPSPPLTPPG